MESFLRKRLRNLFPSNLFHEIMANMNPEEILLKRLSFLEEPDLICVTSG